MLCVQKIYFHSSRSYNWWAPTTWVFLLPSCGPVSLVSRPLATILWHALHVLWECLFLCHLLSFLFVLTYLLLKFVFNVPHRSEFTRHFSFLNGSSRHWEIQGEFCCSVVQLCLTPCDPLDCSLHNVDWLRKPHHKKGKKTSSRSCDLRGVSSQQEREISPLTLLSHPGSCTSSAGVSSTHDSDHLLTD